MPAPAIVHAHALLFMGWVGIVLTQVWLWSVGVLIAALLLSRLIGFSPIGEAIHASVVAGTPQADSNGLDFPSPR
jgi:hypothetical protein